MTNEYNKRIEEYNSLRKQYLGSDFYFKWFESDVDYIKVEPSGSKIIEFFTEKSIFITGGSGFIGKLVIEKLLRACNVKTIYMMIRPKKGDSSSERIEKMLNEEIFSKARAANPNYRSTVVGIEGNVAEPNLGMSDEDMKTLTNANIIIHCAATVRFNEPIRRAANINIQGTSQMLDLAKKCKNLEAFVYVSTAYSNCTRQQTSERFYDPPISADKLFDLIKGHSDEELENMTPNIVGKFPNTYSFTKCVAEDLIKTHSKGLPVSIYRPSVVCSTYLEPIKGYTGSLFGPTGIIIGAGTGLIRTTVCNDDLNIDIVPADYVVNGLIASIYDVAKKAMQEPKIYNYVSSAENPITWRNYYIWLGTHGKYTPSIKTLWAPETLRIKYYYLYYIFSIFVHILPAFLIDTALRLSNKKPFMLNLYKRVHSHLELVRFFSLIDFEFDNQNTQDLWKSLNEKDQYIFPFSMRNCDWNIVLAATAMGCRRFILHEDDSTLPAALKKFAVLGYANKFLKIILLALTIWTLKSIFF